VTSCSMPKIRHNSRESKMPSEIQKLCNYRVKILRKQLLTADSPKTQTSSKILDCLLMNETLTKLLMKINDRNLDHHCKAFREQTRCQVEYLQDETEKITWLNRETRQVVWI